MLHPSRSQQFQNPFAASLPQSPNETPHQRVRRSIDSLRVVKIIQLIDNTSQQSHNPSQQFHAIRHSSSALHSNSPQLLRTNRHNSAVFFAARNKQVAVAGRFFLDQNHTTDRQYTPSSLTTRHSSNGIRHSRSMRFTTSSRRLLLE
jgi:hypothetical protein